MSFESWPRVKALFEELREQPTSARRAALASLSDPALRDEVERLLALDAEADAYFDTLGRDVRSPAGGDGDVAPPPPERAGPWRLLREVGRGGMGAVYLAERADGQFEQDAAVKLVEAATPSLVRRFLHERQILARLQHPHIARLLDGGLLDDGRPYLVMEYVEGEPITAFCDRRRLPIDARLRLFGQVCDAVAHAHRSLVVHRDLKPSNVFVAEGEASEPHVKLLDFGIARLLDDADTAPLTRTGVRLLTPEYAAPEQIRGASVTTATDVYSLGVLLYELLTGCRPHRAATRFVLEQEVLSAPPAPPSTAVTKATEHEGEAPPAERAADRAVEPARLCRRLRGDLDRICLKALRKEPERRYASAEALGRDVERHLRGLPVEARPATVGYRTGAFVRRHRVGVAAAALVLVALLGGLGAALWQAHRAQEEAARTERAHAFLLDLFRPIDPYAPSDEALGADVPMRDFLETAVERVRNEMPGEPALRFQLLRDLEEIYWGLAEPAAQHYVAALNDSLTRAAFPPGSSERIEAGCRLGWAHFNSGQAEPAEPLLRACLVAREALHGAEAPETASALHDLGYFLRVQGRYEHADSLGRRAVALYRRAGAGYHDDLATALEHHALTLIALGRPGEAVRETEEALTIKRDLHGPDHPSVASALANAAAALGSGAADHEVAERYLREAVRIFETSLGPDVPILLTVQNNLALRLWAQGRVDETEVLLRRVLDRFVRHHGEHHVGTADAYQNLGKLLADRGRHAEADLLLHRALAAYRAVLPEGHFKTALPLLTLAGLALEQEDYRAAEAHAREAVTILQAGLPEGHWITSYAEGRLGRALAGQGRDEAAEGLLASACEKMRTVTGEQERTREVCGALDALRTRP